MPLHPGFNTALCLRKQLHFVFFLVRPGFSVLNKFLMMSPRNEMNFLLPTYLLFQVSMHLVLFEFPVLAIRSTIKINEVMATAGTTGRNSP